MQGRGKQCNHCIIVTGITGVRRADSALATGSACQHTTNTGTPCAPDAASGPQQRPSACVRHVIRSPRSIFNGSPWPLSPMHSGQQGPCLGSCIKRCQGAETGAIGQSKVVQSLCTLVNLPQPARAMHVHTYASNPRPCRMSNSSCPHFDLSFDCAPRPASGLSAIQIILYKTYT
jgi:hypothetical protein